MFLAEDGIRDDQEDRGLEDEYKRQLEVAVMSDAGSQLSHGGIGHVRDCENLGKGAAVVDSANLRGRERAGGDDCVHDVVVVLTLERLNF